jgi:hypothetical protein
MSSKEVDTTKSKPALASKRPTPTPMPTVGSTLKNSKDEARPRPIQKAKK